ncbi:MerR family transcriptional regulator [Enterococcus plantarum]|uniref:MerR family transcriptional regulator n=1 Tax=Enterococcus plantarum TaxID=1077675 RepID=A0A2W4BAK8_9ENTE|nr:MerR family transcriptional regulator [Enterococcus plantarum]MBO0467648.1 MerR family transcriptional regulator [Enterococcus plantarum]PZL69872.1 MerR family transcriptional regulator [Enterococcus plantarum]
MFKISEFSELTNISPRMLRYYDKLNVLKPKTIQKENGYRYYTPEQINQANQILSLKTIGIPLKEIKSLLENEDDMSDYLARQRTLLETELAEKKLQLTYLGLLEEKSAAANSEIINYPIEVRMMKETLVLPYRQKVESYYHEEQLWQTLFAKINLQDRATLGNSIAVFQNDPSDSIDIEVMIGIPKKLKSTYSKATLFAPGLIASVVVSGTYERMPKVHEDMKTWLRLNEYILSGNVFNIYHSSPATEEQEELYITEICYPIKKASI